jgi:hypothetical protein
LNLSSSCIDTYSSAKENIPGGAEQGKFSNISGFSE